MSVLLPAPLRPSRHTRSPRSMPRVAPSSTGGPPKAMETSRRVTRAIGTSDARCALRDAQRLWTRCSADECPPRIPRDSVLYPVHGTHVRPIRGTATPLVRTAHRAGPHRAQKRPSPIHRSEPTSRCTERSCIRMPDFDRKTLGSISDEDLLALELDESLPIDDWMAVEKERGRREERRRREAALLL